MEYFRIEGGHRLKGEIIPQGAKNEALQVICATLLTPEPVTLTNVPEILDVLRLIDILECMGVKVGHPETGTFIFRADDINLDYLASEEFLAKARRLRGSIMLMGPLLTRFGEVFISRPGGDKIGRRRLDTHFFGLGKLGGDFHFDAKKSLFSIRASGRLKGTYMLLDEASVTGTANIVMAAVLAEGKTTIYHAACEPYVQHLCQMLNRMGARISGIGSNLLTIEGVEALGGTQHKLLSDMIEVGSFMGMAAMTQGEILIRNTNVEYLGIIPEIFRRMGVNFDIYGDDILVREREVCEIESFMDGSIMTVSDHTWPGFTPDLLSIILVLATQCRGSVLIHQKMFESRLFFVDKLIDMGAKIILCDPHRATVIGLGRQQALRGISMTSPDIRAGVALLIAALSAEGESRIYNIEQIDRGYQNIEGRLRNLGAKIERVKE